MKVGNGFIFLPIVFREYEIRKRNMHRLSISCRKYVNTWYLIQYHIFNFARPASTPGLIFCCGSSTRLSRSVFSCAVKAYTCSPTSVSWSCRTSSIELPLQQKDRLAFWYQTGLLRFDMFVSRTPGQRFPSDGTRGKIYTARACRLSRGFAYESAPYD